jgi:hypothetical protein
MKQPTICEKFAMHEGILRAAEHPFGQISTARALESLDTVRKLAEKAKASEQAKRGISILGDALNHHEKFIRRASLLQLGKISQSKNRELARMAKEAINNCVTNRQNFGESFRYEK